MDLLKFGESATWVICDNGKVATKYSIYGVGTPCRARTANVAPGYIIITMFQHGLSKLAGDNAFSRCLCEDSDW